MKRKSKERICLRMNAERKGKLTGKKNLKTHSKIKWEKDK